MAGAGVGIGRRALLMKAVGFDVLLQQLGASDDGGRLGWVESSGGSADDRAGVLPLLVPWLHQRPVERGVEGVGGETYAKTARQGRRKEGIIMEMLEARRRVFN